MSHSAIEPRQRHTGSAQIAPSPPPRLPLPISTSSSSNSGSSNNSSTSSGSNSNTVASLSSSFRARANPPHHHHEDVVLAPPRSPLGEVSLAVPRPDGERTVNEYVETPLKNCCQEHTQQDCSKLDRFRHHRHQRHVANARQNTHRLHNRIATGLDRTDGHEAGRTASGAPITKQPVSFTKEPANGGIVPGGAPGPQVLAARSYDPAGLSIMCEFCGRCRCESCREPPPLPSRWLCDNSCYCSPETALDYASCLCCVKGLFYHCGGEGNAAMDAEAEASCADEPCSCAPGNRRAARWACLGALTLLLPCLLCYWPFKGCLALCEACYARHAAQGCRCNTRAGDNTHHQTNAGRLHHPIQTEIGDSRDPEKRLLDPVTPDLS